jgi:hypothetical protein
MLTDTQCRAARPREKAYKLTDGSGNSYIYPWKVVTTKPSL